MSTATISAWPEQGEYDFALATIENATLTADELQMRLGVLCDTKRAPSLREGADVPTLEDVGRIAVFLARVEQELTVLHDAVDNVREVMRSAALDTEDPGDDRAPSLPSDGLERIVERLTRQTPNGTRRR